MEGAGDFSGVEPEKSRGCSHARKSGTVVTAPAFELALCLEIYFAVYALSGEA